MGEPLTAVAGDVVTRPAFAARYGARTDAEFVTQAYRNATGASARSSWASARAASLTAGTLTRAALMAEIVSYPSAVTHLRPEVDVTMTYAGLLRRSPDRGGFTYWSGKVRAGTSIQKLIAQFFSSSEYAARFA